MLNINKSFAFDIAFGETFSIFMDCLKLNRMCVVVNANKLIIYSNRRYDENDQQFVDSILILLKHSAANIYPFV